MCVCVAFLRVPPLEGLNCEARSIRSTAAAARPKKLGGGPWTRWQVGQRFRTRMVRRHHNYCGLPPGAQKPRVDRFICPPPGCLARFSGWTTPVFLTLGRPAGKDVMGGGGWGGPYLETRSYASAPVLQPRCIRALV